MADRLPCDEATLRAWLITYITSVLNLPGESVPCDQTFASYGFDSVEVVVMAGVMEEEFGVQVEPAQLFENPSIDGFARAYAAQAAHAAPAAPAAPAEHEAPAAPAAHAAPSAADLDAAP